MKVNIYKIPFAYLFNNWVELKIENRGYIEQKEFDAEECWHICNWSCYSDNKPNNLFGNIDVANSDVIFEKYISKNNSEFYIALPVGWQIIKGTLNDVKQWLITVEKPIIPKEL